jgi:hypothetical protein
MSLPQRTARTADPEPLASALDDVLLRAWASGLAHGADRADVRKLSSALVRVLDEAEHLRRAGRSAMVPAKVVGLLLGGLRARGCRPPAPPA